MSGFRTNSGGLIDRGQKLPFRFDGKAFEGHPGDTLASALLANGVRVMGRSFKYHRPRGVWGAWFDDPNAIFDVSLNGDAIPNCPATTTALQAGMDARAVNATPSAQFDIKGALDWAHRLMPAGFYYKTFMRPNWHLFEPMIRKMAGLGRLDGELIDNYHSAQHHGRCDLLVVGGGGAGLAAARAAAEAGQSVLLVDDHAELGGGLFRRGLPVEGQPVLDWIAAQQAAITAAGGRIMTATTAFGVYDHSMVGLAQERGFGLPPDLWRIRARKILMATGALERPVTFADNDRPGVMGLDGALEYLARYGVLVGRRIAVLADNGFTAPAVDLLRQAGADVQVLPTGSTAKALGGKRLRGVQLGSRKIACDTLLTSGGRTPVVHLWSHAGGKLRWDDSLSAYVPGQPPERMQAIGAANGSLTFEHALAEARAVAIGKTAAKAPVFAVNPLWPDPQSNARQWVDFQHDVTVKDIRIAAQENYVSVEHLKRYTTLGMAADQGKTSNMAGLATMARLQNRPIPEVGTTRFRPPFVPMPFAMYQGQRRGQLFQPLKRLALEPQHRKLGAALGEYGGWLRPAWYGAQDINHEVMAARSTVALFDGSPLGKIEVMGPDAAAFLDFIYYNTVSTLKTGAIRYGFMLTEGGIVFDDGVISRIEDQRFLISCSSSHVAGVVGALEAWRQDGHDPNRIFIHNTTANWATLTLTGPKARAAMATLELGPDLADFSHMTWQSGVFQGAQIRISRVSFTGDTSFEITVANADAPALWGLAKAEVDRLQGAVIGVEALSVLRAEKGYLIIGKDTDGETMPHDLGFGIPRQKKRVAFVGDRSLHTEVANRPDRRQLVGLASETLLTTGAHVIEAGKSGGFVTSAYYSPTLGRPIALALVNNGRARLGETVTVRHMDHEQPAEIVSPVFLDPMGERLNA